MMSALKDFLRIHALDCTVDALLVAFLDYGTQVVFFKFDEVLGEVCKFWLL